MPRIQRLKGCFYFCGMHIIAAGWLRAGGISGLKIQESPGAGFMGGAGLTKRLF